MRLEDDLNQEEKRYESYHTKPMSSQLNISFHFGNIIFCFIVIKAGSPT